MVLHVPVGVAVRIYTHLRPHARICERITSGSALERRAFPDRSRQTIGWLGNFYLAVDFFFTLALIFFYFFIIEIAIRKRNGTNPNNKKKYFL